MDLIRVIFGFLKRDADARKNMRSLLDMYVRPKLTTKIDFKPMLEKLIDNARQRMDVDPDVFAEDIVDMVIEERKGVMLKLISNIEKELEDTYGLSEEESAAIVDPAGRLSDKIKEKLDTYAETAGKVTNGFFKDVLNKMSLRWQAKHHKDQSFEKMHEKNIEPSEERSTEDDIDVSGDKDFDDPKTRALHEDIAEELAQLKMRRKLRRQVMKYVTEKVTGAKTRDIYKKILEERYLTESPKSQEQVAKDLDYDPSSLSKYETSLLNFLKEMFAGKTEQSKEIKEQLKEEGYKKIDSIPNYQEVLKKKENSDDFKEFYNIGAGTKGAPSEATKKVMDLLAEGKSVAEIVEETKWSRSNIDSIKSRYFKPEYEKWYKENADKLKKAAWRIMRAMINIIAAEEKKEDETRSDFEKYVMKQVTEKNPFEIDIDFSAKYDNAAVAGGKADPEKDDPEFKYKNYSLRMELKQLGWDLQYIYTSKLNDDGSFAGQGSSSLKTLKTIKGEKKEYHFEELKGEIDKYVEDEILTEGTVPHKGGLMIEYHNKSSSPLISGREDMPWIKFVKLYKGLGYADPRHKERLEQHERWEETKQKYKSGPRREDIHDDDKKVLKELSRLRDDLKREKSKPAGSPQLIKEYDEAIKKLEDHVKGRDEMEKKDINDMISRLKSRKREMDIQAAVIVAAVLAPAQNEKVRKLILLLDDYKAKPNPKLWLEAADLVVLARVFTSMHHANKERDLKGAKGKDKKEQLESIEKEYTDQLALAKEAFAAFPADLKRRLELTKPADRDELARKYDLKWVDNEEKVKSTLDKVKDELEKHGKLEITKSQPSIKMIEKPKFEALEAFLENIQGDVYTMAARLEKADLKPAGGDEARNKILEAQEKIRNFTSELRGQIAEMKKGRKEDDEDSAALTALEKKIKEEDIKLQDERDKHRMLSTAPAVGASVSLHNLLSYFSSMYSLIHSFLWFRDKTVKAEESEEKEDKKKVEWGEGITNPEKFQTLRENIVTVAKKISKVAPLRNPISYGKIKSLMGKIRPLFDDFHTAFPKRASNNLPYEPVVAAEGDREKAIEKAVIPGDEAEHAKKLIKQLSESKNKKRQELAPQAQSDWNRLVKTLVEAFKEGLSIDRVREIAKKRGISEDKARILLKNHENAFIRAGIRTFMDKWNEVLEMGGLKKERSPQGNRPATEYENIGDVVEQELPELFKMVPEDKDPEEPDMAIPTRQKINEIIDKNIEEPDPKVDENSQALINKYDDAFKDTSGAEHGGKSKSKGRKKAIKPPPPEGTWEELKEQVIKLFKDKDAEDIVLTTMALYLRKVKYMIEKKLEAGQFVDPDEAIDAIVTVLKKLYNAIKLLKVEPSHTPRMPLPGMPQLSGKPDIAIDSLEEATKVFNKIKDIIDEINYYIKPDKVGIPIKNISEMQKYKTYLPTGLTDWLPFFQKHEKYFEQHREKDWEKKRDEYKTPVFTPSVKKTDEKKPAETEKKAYDYHSQMSYNVAMRFSSLEMEMVEKLGEENLI